MNLTLLHVLSQRPRLTGSGTTLDAFAYEASKKGWNQHAVVGVPKGAPYNVKGIDSSRVHPLTFEDGDLDFPVPGMSDAMPYESTRFSSMTERQLSNYKKAWKKHLGMVVSEVKPDIILTHHIWIVSSLIKDVAPSIPVVTQCHATGLRQMELSPHLAQDVVRGCKRNDRFVVLRTDHANQLQHLLGVDSGSVKVVGAGYDDELFHSRGRVKQNGSRLLYVGKLSTAKGLPWLLNAVEALDLKGIELDLNVAGAGSGDEATTIKEAFGKLGGILKYHGQLEQPQLAELMRSCGVCVLPSFYEGVPLVLVEAFACGCRLVSTELPGVVDELYPHMGDAIALVPLPGLIDVDTPDPKNLPGFTENLSAALEAAIHKGPINIEDKAYIRCCQRFTWKAVFERVEEVLLDSLGSY